MLCFWRKQIDRKFQAGDPALKCAVAEIERRQRALNRLLETMESIMSQGLDDIKVAVTRLATDVRALADKVVAADSQQALEAVATQLNSIADSAEAAINPPPPAPPVT